MNLDKIFDFVRFTHEFQQVRRVLLVNNEERQENDAEHSFQLAMVGWYLIESMNLDLNVNKVIKYALVHDLVEVYAGDTYFFTTDDELRNGKKKREEEALKQIEQRFPQARKLVKLMEEYENKINDEVKFVYALDKILPVMNIYLDNGKSWRRAKVDLKMLWTKEEKIKLSPEIYQIWKELWKLLKKNEKKLFNNE